MSVTDQYVANEVVYRALENGANDAAFPTLLTDMFSAQEILDSMNRVQQEFLLETGAIVTRVNIAGSIGTPHYDVPANSIRPRRLTWTDASDLKTRVLTQVDTWELDNGASNWPADRDIPIAWTENTLPQQTVGIAKNPLNDGVIGLLYVALAATLDGTGVVLAVPDDFAPYIVWGTLGELLSSDGVSYDPVRAQYCNRRFQEGIELARIILGGAN